MQRRPRLGDILDDYCPRERRVTNHAVVAMIGDVIRLTRCGTCDAEHDYKAARQPRLRKKDETGALAMPVIVVPKRVVQPPAQETPQRAVGPDVPPRIAPPLVQRPERVPQTPRARLAMLFGDDEPRDAAPADVFTGTIVTPAPAAASAASDALAHRPLIRAQLPRATHQPVSARQATDFTIRQPQGRNRFRGRRANAGFQGPSSRTMPGSPKRAK